MSPTPRPLSPPVITWRALMEAHERVMHRLRPALREHGLSINEFDVLVNLDPDSDARHTDLADRVVLSRTALTRLVDRLVERGLLERGSDEHDGRSVRIRLSSQGTRLRAQACATNDRVVEEAFAALGPSQLAALEDAARALSR